MTSMSFGLMRQNLGNHRGRHTGTNLEKYTHIMEQSMNNLSKYKIQL